MSALHQLSNPARSQPPSRVRPQTKPVRRAKLTPKQRQQQQHTRHRRMAIEVSLKIGMNVLISGVALTTLFNLVSHRLAQQQKLQELQAEVQVTENRVNQLKANFNQVFDPGQERQIVQDQTHFVDPNRTPIVWLTPKGQTTAQLPK